MTKEQAIERLKKMIQINNGVIKEARKNGDIFAMQLTADLDTDSIAIEKVLTMLEEKDKTIDLMAEQLAGLAIFNIDKDETLILSDKEEVKQYFENKVKELLNK